MGKEGKFPMLYVGRKALINYDILCDVFKTMKLVYIPTAQDLISFSKEKADA